jgi:VWFA-related protein
VAQLNSFVRAASFLLFLTIPPAHRVADFAGQSTPNSNRNQQETEPPQSKNPIRTATNEVIVPVTVTDKKGEMVLDLVQKDFHVFDKGAEQAILRFDIDADPLAVALVVDTNVRLRAMAPVIRGMGGIFTETVMALSGEAAVISYGTDAAVSQGFTQDHEAVEQAIAGIQFQSGDSNLYDAMAKGLELLKTQPSEYRRVLLVVGESQDTHSKAKLSEVLREAQMQNVVIYAIGPSSTSGDLRYGKGEAPGERPPPSVKLGRLPPVGGTGLAAVAVWMLTRGTNEISNHQLEVAAASTGGIHYRALHQETIRTALDRVGGELHAQYVLSFAPNADPPEGFNEIKVTVSRADVTIRARPGYYVLKRQ